MSAPRLNNTTKISETGMPTIELLKYTAELARYVETLKAENTALAARVTALEALHP